MSGHIEGAFRSASCTGWLCVQDSAGDREVALSADEPVVAASVIKVLVGLTAELAFAAGDIDEAHAVRLPAGRRTPGPAGMSLFQDDAMVSARDLVSAMLTISDNVATDALIEMVGIESCRQLATDLALTGTVLTGSLHDMVDSIAHDAGLADWRALTAWSSTGLSEPEQRRVDGLVRASAELDPRRATRTTPRDMCRLLRLIWTDQAGDAGACARIRNHLSHQLTRHRLAAGSPTSQVSAKSGGLVGVIRNEIGVIREPNGQTFYVAVFTRADEGAIGSRIDAAIGQAAALAIAELRDSA
jgi:beta-lactamase class A